MKFRCVVLGSLLTFLLLPAFSADDYRPGPDSLPQPGVPKGTIVKDSYTAAETSVFPGTLREYQVYLPAGFDASKPVPFMVFQDGAIYQAPVVFDNLIAKKEIPPLVGIFVKPGVVPAANDNALPRFNRSYEYDSVNGNYARFLVDELVPAIEKKQGIRLSTDPNDAAIAGSSSGGICAWQVAWERPDRFRRVFTSVGTYVGIHGGDQIPVLVRKMEPKPIRIFLQSGSGDNNLYCGDWWMANQTMERALTWAGYDVNHAWGDGGHNQKHATTIFPDVLRWLWRDWQTSKEIKANPRGESKWKGYEVVGEGEWQVVARLWDFTSKLPDCRKDRVASWSDLASNKEGDVFASESTNGFIVRARPGCKFETFGPRIAGACGMAVQADGNLAVCSNGPVALQRPEDRPDSMSKIVTLDPSGKIAGEQVCEGFVFCLALTQDGQRIALAEAKWGAYSGVIFSGSTLQRIDDAGKFHNHNASDGRSRGARALVLTPDQTQVFASQPLSGCIELWKLAPLPEGAVACQRFVELDRPISTPIYERDRGGGMCVDTNGWLYVATDLGVQVLDPCGRVNFILPTPKQPHDVCFGGPDLSELFIACGDAIYKRKTKAHGYLSGQMAPIKPAAPKL